MVVRWKFWILFLILLFVLSYFREVSFVSINAIMNGETEFYAKTTKISFLQDYSPTTLQQIKFILTILFSFLFILISTLGLKFTFNKKAPYQVSLFIYGILILIAVFISFSYIFGTSFQTIYPILRKLVGWIHNPILFLAISIGSYSMQMQGKIEN